MSLIILALTNEHFLLRLKFLGRTRKNRRIYLPLKPTETKKSLSLCVEKACEQKGHFGGSAIAKH